MYYPPPASHTGIVIFIVLLILLVIAASGFGIWWYMKHKKNGTSPTESFEVVPESTSLTDADGGGFHDQAELTYATTTL